MPFSEIKGQEQAIEGLSKALEQSKLAHAYLFAGPEGVGKKKTAQILAKSLNCNYPFILSPIGESIKIEQIRQLQKDIHLKPADGQKKVYLLEEAEKMTEQAANSLLKILEEPPEYALLILLTSSPELILPTIRSRCQPVFFYSLPENIIQECLDFLLNEGKEKIPLLIRLGNGSLGHSLQLASEEDYWKKRETSWTILEEIIQQKRDNFMANSEKIEKEGRENIRTYLSLLSGFLRDLLIWQQTKKDKFLINIDKKQTISSWSSLFSSGQLIEMIKEIEKCRKLIKRNVNGKLALEVLFLQLSKRGEGKKCV